MTITLSEHLPTGQELVLKLLINLEELWKARNQILRQEMKHIDINSLVQYAQHKAPTYTQLLKLATCSVFTTTPRNADPLYFNYIICFNGSFSINTGMAGWSFLLYNSQGDKALFKDVVLGF